MVAQENAEPMTRRFTVTGHVQGVGFRWFVARHARSLGLSGFARNLVDGRVEVVAAGDEAALVQLEGLLRSGPANAQVTGVECADQINDPQAPTRSFDIR
jgi:acylphosphatase